jgi:hypothetical protein
LLLSGQTNLIACPTFFIQEHMGRTGELISLKSGGGIFLKEIP